MKKKIAVFLSVFILLCSFFCFSVFADSEDQFTFSNPVILNPYHFTFSWKDGYGSEGGPTSVTQNSNGLEVSFQSVSGSVGRTINFSGVSDNLFLQGGYLYRFQWRVYHTNSDFYPMSSPVLSVFGTDGVNQNLQIFFDSKVDEYGGTYYNYHSYFWVPENVGLSLDLNFTLKATTSSGYFYVYMYYPTRLSTTDIAVQSNSKLLDAIQSGQTSAVDEIIANQDKNADQITDAINNIIPGDQYEMPDTGLDDYKSSEDQLMDMNQDGFSSAQFTIQNALTSVLQFVGGFQVIQLVLGAFTDLPFFSALITVSIAVGLFATLLGIGLSFLSRDRLDSRSESRYWRRYNERHRRR